MILVCIAYARQSGTDLLLTLNDWSASRERLVLRGYKRIGDSIARVCNENTALKSNRINLR